MVTTCVCSYLSSIYLAQRRHLTEDTNKLSLSDRNMSYYATAHGSWPFSHDLLPPHPFVLWDSPQRNLSEHKPVTMNNTNEQSNWRVRCTALGDGQEISVQISGVWSESCFGGAGWRRGGLLNVLTCSSTLWIVSFCLFLRLLIEFVFYIQYTLGTSGPLRGLNQCLMMTEQRADG